MCGEYGPQRFNFRATLGHKISKNSGHWSISQKFSTGFGSVLVNMSIWGTFRGVLNIGLRDSIFGSFKAAKYNTIQVLNHSLKYFPLVLVSYPCRFTCLLVVCLGVFYGVFSLATELVWPPGLLFASRRYYMNYIYFNINCLIEFLVNTVRVVLARS